MKSLYSLPLLSMLLPASTVMAKFDCMPMVGDKKFDLTSLRGMHSVSVIDPGDLTVMNTTWTIDPCAPIKKFDKIPDEEQCESGTRICGITTITKPKDPSFSPITAKVITVAGDIADNRLDAVVSLLSKSPAHSEAGTEGLLVEMHGGTYEGKKQTAYVEFICDRTKTGWEGQPDGRTEPGEGDKVVDSEGLVRREDGSNPTDASLTCKSYMDDMLWLSWRTKYACDTTVDGGKKPKGGKGFFTWFIIVLFLGIAAYLIFGSWLNYNKYGARGWDLLPHSDTIRDLPYLFRDFLRRMINTFSGSGSRGGYSAV